MAKRGWDKSPSLSIVFGLSSKTQWLSGLYYADFISFYSPTQLCGGGTTKSNSNQLPISVPLSFAYVLFFKWFTQISEKNTADNCTNQDIDKVKDWVVCQTDDEDSSVRSHKFDARQTNKCTCKS